MFFLCSFSALPVFSLCKWFSIFHFIPTHLHLLRWHLRHRLSSLSLSSLSTYSFHHLWLMNYATRKESREFSRVNGLKPACGLSPSPFGSKFAFDLKFRLNVWEVRVQDELSSFIGCMWVCNIYIPEVFSSPNCKFTYRTLCNVK